VNGFYINQGEFIEWIRKTTMQLSTRGRYAVMALIDLAALQVEPEGETRAVKLEEVANRQGISLSYLEQLFSQLRKAEVVKSVRGPGGGYKLFRDENDIYMYDIINAVNEGTKATRCDGLTGCLNAERCNSHELWSALGGHIDDFMRQVSLKMAREKKITVNGHIISKQEGGKAHVRISG
jgi:Rrf2 family iron-sulfur cluster assembly transcriptional regulator